MVTVWKLTYGKRPWTTNKDRTLHPHARAKLVKEWRTAFAGLAKDCNVPSFEKIGIIVTPLLPDRRLQDTAACNPAAKAAIDGLVDYGVIPNDTPEYLGFIRFNSCIVQKGVSGLTLEIVPLLECDKCHADYPKSTECCK